MSNYRTKTYIAGDWDADKDAVDKLHEWNNSKYWSLSFSDAHDLTSSRDSTLNCNIKVSLKKRMDASKTFVLIVGEHTNNVTAGSCSWCGSYNSYTSHCAKGYSIDNRSYIKYECEKAIEAGIKIIVLYKCNKVDRNKCPEIVRWKGRHSAMTYIATDAKEYWDYNAVYDALNS
ncbi:MAG: molecular chaperone Tir [Bacilli bacterium]